jgi:hypothetical protein
MKQRVKEKTRSKQIGGGNPHPNQKGLTTFAKGNPGKKPGTQNKITVKLKEAILEAAERSGSDGKGKDGTVGYLKWLSRAEPAVYGRMLEKLLPMQLDVKDTTNKPLTPEEAVERLKERGLPVPQSLIDLTSDPDKTISLTEEEYEEAAE